jgi:Thioredoxin like C-terminal domain
LLAESGAATVSRDLVAVDPKGVELAADWKNLKSSENYLGYERTNNFVSRDGTIEDKHHHYVAPYSLRLHHWALSGDWIIRHQSIISILPRANITYRFHQLIRLTPPIIDHEITIEFLDAGAEAFSMTFG